MNRPSKIASFDVDAQKGFTRCARTNCRCPAATPSAPPSTNWPAAPRCAWAAGRAQPEGCLGSGSAEQMLRPLAYPDADLTWVSHCVPGTPGFELLDELPRPIDYDFFVWKGVEPDLHPYGACYHDLAERRSTGVIEYLRQNGVSHVLVGGLALDYCVKNTALQLRRAGFGAALPARLPGHRRGHRAAGLRRDARRRGDPLRRPERLDSALAGADKEK